jgi:RNA polymerase sigma factor for flagellar operon FliA
MPINGQALGISSCASAARSEAIEQSLPLVRSIAARLKQAYGLTAPFEDLLGLGVDGLLQAAERFDPTRGVAFTTFAYYRIRGAILDSLRRDPDRGRLARTGPWPRALGEPENDNGVPEREAALPDLTGLVETAVVRLRDVEGLADDQAAAVDEQIERRSVERRLATALGRLPEQERRIIELRYYEELSFAQIGERLGICKPWAFRLHARALRLLKRSLAGLRDREPSPTRG